MIHGGGDIACIFYLQIILSYDLELTNQTLQNQKFSKEGVDFVKLIGPDWSA